MPPILSMSMWTSLSSEQRRRIREAFEIPRSRSVEVHDGAIVTDGTTADDFKALTVEKMQVYLADESTDFHKLFDKVVAKIQDDIEGRPVILPEISQTPVTETITKPHAKKTKSK